MALVIHRECYVVSSPLVNPNNTPMNVQNRHNSSHILQISFDEFKKLDFFIRHDILNLSLGYNESNGSNRIYIIVKNSF